MENSCSLTFKSNCWLLLLCDPKHACLGAKDRHTYIHTNEHNYKDTSVKLILSHSAAKIALKAFKVNRSPK